MNIKFVANTSWYVFNFRLETLRRFVQQGDDVTVVCGDNIFEREIRKAGARFEVVELSPNGVNLFGSLLATYRLYCNLKNTDGIVFSFTPKVNFYISLFISYTTLIWYPNVSGFGKDYESKNLTGFVKRLAVKLMVRKADGIFVQNERDFDVIASNRAVAPDAVMLLPGSGVDLSKFPYSPIDSWKKFSFCFAGRLIPEKGVLNLLDALKQLSELSYSFKCVIAGSVPTGKNAKVVQQAIDEAVKQGYVDYCGVVSDVYAIIRDSRCVVFPSFYGEGTPKFLLEAAAVGRLIITTDEPGCKRVAQTVGNVIIEKTSVTQLVQALKSVLELNLETLNEVGFKNSQFVAKYFNEEIAISSYLQVRKNFND